MHRVVYILTFAAMSVHILLGCCLCHAHEFGAVFESQALAVETSHACPGHGHGENEGPDKQDGHHDHEPHQQLCDGGTCVFMRADSVVAPDLSIRHNSLATASVLTCLISSDHFERADTRLDRLGKPTPIHLANQALLL